MPVALDTDGNIEPYIPGGDGSQVYLGIAVTDNINPAYQAQRNFPVEVTVAVEAFMVVNWVAKEAMECGYVKPTDTLLIDRLSLLKLQTMKQNSLASYRLMKLTILSRYWYDNH